MTKEYDKESFYELKEEIHNMNIERIKYYNLLQKSESEYVKNKLETMCQHKWEIDNDSCDPCRVFWECKKCKIGRIFPTCHTIWECKKCGSGC